ncbi:MAG: class B sortase [Oscillospiraceae bacterium]|jgi:sortase B|nr:class B sortase [Oscillospiraceae bacterium]
MTTATANKIGRAAVRAANSIVNLAVLVVILLLVAVAVYAIWDSDRVYRAADAAQYAVYKPSAEEEESISFAELQAINPDVFSWLTVYGTNIDYPVTQGANNEKYVTTDAFGKYSLSGAIFLDFMNSSDFGDFNSILYGHHMEKQTMFGEIGLFSAKTYFDDHAYGNLYYDGKNHGLEFFAFLHADAYDSGIFTPRIDGDEARQRYLGNLLEKSRYTRDIGVTTDDHIILLSTCSSDSTNGRDILVARITDERCSDPFIVEEKGDTYWQQASVDRQSGIWERVPLWARIGLFAIPLLLIVCVLMNRRKRSKEQRK